MAKSKFSDRDFTGRNLSSEAIPVGEVIENSCFSQESPDASIFPATMRGVTFVDCNLDNVFIPPGNVVRNCSQKRFAVQNDGEDWLIDGQGRPVRPIAEKQYRKLGLSVDPRDIPRDKNPVSVVARALSSRGN